MIAFMVAGTGSGVGKTTVALALMAAFRERSQIVQPFKCGPDFLDTGHHTAVCGRAARNLDTWMMSTEANRALFEHSCRDANVAIAEGMMGLFDGIAGGTEEGSAAQIAKLLDLPVVLVLDAGKSARSIAAVVKGFESFDTELRYAGLVLNGVSSEQHYRILQTSIESVTATPLLGRIPREPALAIPERYLGLRTVEEEASPQNRFAVFAEAAREYLDLGPLMSLSHPYVPCETNPTAAPHDTTPSTRIGVARDEAFSFYYEDNLDLLREHGADIVPFSPLHDRDLPPHLDLLYLGGGYPELYAKTLSANRPMREAIRAFADSSRPVYAECGGMMYLGRSVAAVDGDVFPMAEVLPLEFEMTSRLSQFGYVEVEFTGDCLLGKKGVTARGHSFHHSRLRRKSTIPTCYRVRYSLSGQSEQEGFCDKSVLASYIHLHFRGNPVLVPSLLEAARRGRTLEIAR